ncbi:MAG: stage II sporulation protein R [Oscillospiraceae bacterium]
MKRWVIDILMLAGLLAAFAIGGMTAFARNAQAVQSEVLRLHIPANSDSEADQSIKLALRDALLERYGAMLSDSASLCEAEERAEALLPEIEQFSCDFLRENGADYSAKAELTDMYFTTRKYDRVTLPAGNYRALRITLGSGEGHNWWCIMFPPLCLPCAEAPEDEDIVSSDSVLAEFEAPQKITVKFAIYEWLKELLSE